MPPASPGTRGLPLVDDLVAPGALAPAFQPIVDLTTGLHAGYEALARWPELGVAPDAAFDAARRADRLHDLDWACRLAAVTTATDAGLGRGRPGNLLAGEAVCRRLAGQHVGARLHDQARRHWAVVMPSPVPTASPHPSWHHHPSSSTRWSLRLRWRWRLPARQW